MASLYRRLLGPALDTLPPTLQKFHDVETEWQGHADFKITRGRGWLRGLIAWVGGLPPAGDAVPMELRIVAEGEAERWIRQFGRHRLESVQRAWKGLMVESFGAITLGFRLVIDRDAVRLVPARAWVLGIPWPLWLAPNGTGIEIGKDDGCSIVARAELPLLGLLVQYEGLVVEGTRLNGGDDG
jgi:hypothetical protein